MGVVQSLVPRLGYTLYCSAILVNSRGSVQADLQSKAPLRPQQNVCPPLLA